VRFHSAMAAVGVAVTIPAAMAVAQVPAGGEFRVNSYTTGGQYDASVAVDKSGGFIVAWDSDGQDGDHGGIFARRFDAGGTPLGAEFRVNETTTDQQLVPAVAIDGRGTVLITWTGADQSGLRGVPGSRESGESRYAGIGSSGPTSPNRADAITRWSCANAREAGGRVDASSPSYSTPSKRSIAAIVGPLSSCLLRSSSRACVGPSRNAAAAPRFRASRRIADNAR